MTLPRAQSDLVNSGVPSILQPGCLLHCFAVRATPPDLLSHSLRHANYSQLGVLWPATFELHCSVTPANSQSQTFQEMHTSYCPALSWTTHAHITSVMLLIENDLHRSCYPKWSFPNSSIQTHWSRAGVDTHDQKGFSILQDK